MRHISIRRKTAEIVPSKKMDEGRNMAEIKLKKREEMDPAYCWDLSSLFGSDEEFEKTEQELAKKIEAFRAKQGTMKESAKALYDVLSGLDDISRVFPACMSMQARNITRIWEIRSIRAMPERWTA